MKLWSLKILNLGSSQWDSSQFRTILSNTILDYSPFVKVLPPYTHTEKGKLSSIRLGLPGILYWSSLLTDSGSFQLQRVYMPLFLNIFEAKLIV